jgi:hypothetical protein
VIEDGVIEDGVIEDGVIEDGVIEENQAGGFRPAQRRAFVN